MRLSPDPFVTPEALEQGKRALVKDAAWASLVGSLYGGVIHTGFALELGATVVGLVIGAALPFLAQLAQLPTISLVERVRQRRKIAVAAVTVSRLLLFALALLALLPDHPAALHALLAAQVLITLFGSIGGCAVNAWLHQLLAQQGLGELFSRRLFWSTVMTSLGALAAGVLLALGPWNSAFGFTALPLPLLAMITAITVVYLAVAEVAKRAAMSTLGRPMRIRPLVR